MRSRSLKAAIPDGIENWSSQGSSELMGNNHPKWHDEWEDRQRLFDDPSWDRPLPPKRAYYHFESGFRSKHGLYFTYAFIFLH